MPKTSPRDSQPLPYEPSSFFFEPPPGFGPGTFTALAPYFMFEPMVGIEPTTHALRKRCSTTELHRHNSAGRKCYCFVFSKTPGNF